MLNQKFENTHPASNNQASNSSNVSSMQIDAFR